jgi:hypothetical protein
MRPPPLSVLGPDLSLLVSANLVHYFCPGPLDKSASALVHYQAELLTAIVSGTLRRNVLGAIASAKNDCNFPERSDDNRDGCRKRDKRKTAGITVPNALEEDASDEWRYPYRATQKKPFSA